MKKTFHEKEITVGMIGTGFISDTHFEAFKLRRGVRVKALSDSDQALLIKKGISWRIRELYPDYRFMLKDKTIDVIDVMTPHYLHKKCVCDALKAGKDVICEKPLTTSEKDVDEIIKVSESTKKKVYVKQYLRFSRSYQKAHDLILNNATGAPYFAQCSFTGNSSDYINPNTWRANTVEAGGGVFIDIGVHMVDVMQSFFGSPVEISAQTRKITDMFPYKGEDVISALIGFPNNMLVNINCTQIDSGYGFRWETLIYGRKGIIKITDIGKQKKVLHVIKENRVVYEFIEHDWWRLANIRALHDITDRIRERRAPEVPLLEARTVIETVTSAYRSAGQNKKVYIMSKR